MDTMGYQTLVTEWGLGRVRAQEGETLDNAEDPGPPDAAPIFVAYSHLSCGLVTMAHYSCIPETCPTIIQRVEGFVPLWKKERYMAGGADGRLDRLECYIFMLKF